MKPKVIVIFLILSAAGYFFYKENKKNKLDLSLFLDSTALNHKELDPKAKIIVKAGAAKCFLGDLDAAILDTRVKRRRSFIFSIENLVTGKSIYNRRVSVASKDFVYDMPFSIFEDGIYGIFLCSGSKAPCFTKGRVTEDVNKVLKGAMDSSSVERSLTRKEIVYSGNVFVRRFNHIVASQFAIFGPNLMKEYTRFLGRYFPEINKKKELYSRLENIHNVFKPAPLIGPGLGSLKNIQTKDNQSIVFIISKADQDCDYKLMRSAVLGY